MGCGTSKFRTTAEPQGLELGLTVADKHEFEAKDSHHQLSTIPAGLGNSSAQERSRSTAAETVSSDSDTVSKFPTQTEHVIIARPTNFVEEIFVSDANFCGIMQQGDFSGEKLDGSADSQVFICRVILS